MKGVLGVPLLSLVLASTTMLIENVEPTDIFSATTELFTPSEAIASMKSTAMNTFTVNMVSASVSIDAREATTGETSFSSRLPDATRDEMAEYHDDRISSASAEDWLRPASDNVPVPEGACSARRQVTDGDASRGRNAAPTGSTATAMPSEEAEAEAKAGAGAVDLHPPPRTDNWRSWLPFWCRHWSVIGTKGVPRDTQLQVFSEALERHSARDKSYWLQLSANDEEHDSSEVSQTQLVSAAIRQSELLQEFYQWIYQQLKTSEAFGDCSPESLYRFLDALEHQEILVESLCNWSPALLFMSNAGNSSVYEEFFWVLDRQRVWTEIFTMWAIGQYYLGVAPCRHQGWWLTTRLVGDAPALNMSQNLHTRNHSAGDSPSGVDELANGTCSAEDICGEREPEQLVHDAPALNMSQNLQTRNHSAGDGPSDVEELANSACSAENIHGEREPEHMARDENFNGVLGEVAANRKSWSDQRQLELLENPQNQEGELPTCPFQRLRDSETGELLWTEWLPMSHSENGRVLGEGSEHFETTTIPPRNKLDPLTDEVRDVYPDRGFYDHHSLNMLQLEERTRESIVVEDHDGDTDKKIAESPKHRRCSEMPVLQVLGSFFEPPYVLYVRCNDRDDTCDPPETCQPVLTVVSVVMPPWAQLPHFPHTVINAGQLPDGRMFARLMLPTSCTCIEPL